MSGLISPMYTQVNLGIPILQNVMDCLSTVYPVHIDDFELSEKNKLTDTYESSSFRVSAGIRTEGLEESESYINLRVELPSPTDVISFKGGIAPFYQKYPMLFSMSTRDEAYDVTVRGAREGYGIFDLLDKGEKVQVRIKYKKFKYTLKEDFKERFFHYSIKNKWLAVSHQLIELESNPLRRVAEYTLDIERARVSLNLHSFLFDVLLFIGDLSEGD